MQEVGYSVRADRTDRAVRSIEDALEGEIERAAKLAEVLESRLGTVMVRYPEVEADMAALTDAAQSGLRNQVDRLGAVLSRFDRIIRDIDL